MNTLFFLYCTLKTYGKRFFTKTLLRKNLLRSNVGRNIGAIFQNSSVFFFFALFAAGCAAREEALKPELKLSAAEVISSVNNFSASIHTFTAAGSVDVQTPRMAQSASFDLALKKPDSIRLVIEGPFGITVGKALFTRTTFKFYNAFSNTVYEGDTEKGLHMLPTIDGFNAEILMDAMSGVRTFNETHSHPDSFYTVNNSYMLVFTTDTEKILFMVDATSMKITEVKTLSATNTLLREEFYSYEQSTEGVWRPLQVKISLPVENMSVEIFFDTVSINPNIEALLVTFPDDANHIIIN